MAEKSGHRKNIAHSFLNLARFSNTVEMIFFKFWKEMAIAKLTTSAIGQKKILTMTKMKKLFSSKSSKLIFTYLLKRYKSIVDAIRFAILEYTKISLNDINKSIKKLARLNFDF